MQGTQKKIPENLTGLDFVELVRREVEVLNNGPLGRASLTELSVKAGFSKATLRQLLAAEEPNPKILMIRSVLFVLNYFVPDAEKDVIPHLKSKGVYSENTGGTEND